MTDASIERLSAAMLAGSGPREFWMNEEDFDQVRKTKPGWPSPSAVVERQDGVVHVTYPRRQR